MHPTHFNNFQDGHPVPITWAQIHQRITAATGDVYQRTQLSREALAKGQTQEAARLKASMGFFTPAVQMTGGRREQHITAFTGDCMCDFDHIDRNHIRFLIERVSHDPHTRLAYITNSQEGIRIIFRWQAVLPEAEDTPPAEQFFTFDPQHETHEEFMARCLPYHQRAWLWGNRYYQQLLDGAPMDEHCKDPNRISFYCHDLHAYLNPEPEAFLIALGEDIPSPMPADDEPRGTGQRPIADVILHLLDRHGYAPGKRHGWWLKLGFRIRFYRYTQQDFPAFRTEALRLLTERNLLLPDDPSLRLPHEVDDCLAWGFEHGEQPHPTSPKGEEEGPDSPDAPDDPDDQSDDDEIIEKQCPLLPDEVYLNLPLCLLQGLAPVLDFQWDEERQQATDICFREKMPRRRADALLMSLLTNYSVICSNTHVLYGERDYSPNMAFMCLSPAGNGKNLMEYGFRIVDATDRYLEKISLQEHLAWEEKELKKELKQELIRQLKRKPETTPNPSTLIPSPSTLIPSPSSQVPSPSSTEPPMRLMAMPGTTSRSQFTICMNAMAEDGLIMNSTEINTILATLKLDVGNFVDLLCKATMNERISQFFKIDKRPIKIEKPKLSMCLSGTFDQFHNFIPSIEDGLYSRFFVMMMEPYNEWIPQKPDLAHRAYKDIYERLSEDALQMWLMLGENPTWVTFTDEQWDDHTQHYTEQTDQLAHEGMGNNAAILKRHGLGQMRIAAVLTTLRKWEIYKQAHFQTTEEGEQPGKEVFRQQHRTMTCRYDDYETAALITDTLMHHALNLSTTMKVQRQKHVQPMRNWIWVKEAMDSLPYRFTAREWVNMAQKLGRSRSQAYRSLKNAQKHQFMRQKCENGVLYYYKSMD